MANTIAVSILADVKDLQKNLANAEGDVKGFAATADAQADKAGRSFEGLGESADHMASSSAQAAGGLGDLGGALQLLPGPLAGLGAGMEAAAPAIMGVTGAADLLNLATERFPILAKAQTVATKAMTVAQRAMNAVMRANPIGLIITALILLGTALVIAYKKSTTFRNIVNGAWAGIRTGIGAAWRVIRPIFNLYQSYLGLIGRAAVGMKNLAVGAFNGVVNAVTGIPGKILNAAGKFKDAGKTLINKIVEGLKSVTGFAGDIAGGVYDALKDKINDLITGLNNAIPNSLGAGPLKVNLPDNPIPHLAKGGITSGPMLAVIGDNASGKEAVVPLDKNGNSPFGGDTYIINVNAGAWGNPVAAANEIEGILRAGRNAGVRQTK